ncbi:hypothetical protein EBU71_07910 [bacterium]|nr:hypothetical protein [Candidatus Elulimicrobium humile]
MSEFTLISQLLEIGSPIAASIIAFYFVYLTIKFILAGVTNSVTGMGNTIKRLDHRVFTMTNQLITIDVKVSTALGLKPDYERLARAELRDKRRD